MIPGRSVLGIIGLGVRRVLGRLRGPAPGRTLAAIAGIAAAVAVLVVVTGLAVGLAGAATISGDDVDYWVTPDDQAVGSTPFAYEGTRLSGVHTKATEIAADERVDHATPVATQLMSFVNQRTDEQAYVLVLGVVPGGVDSIAGIATTALADGDPFYNDGQYDGRWTGELITAPATTDQLSAAVGDQLTATGTQLSAGNAAGDDSFQVTETTETTPETGFTEIPVAVVHLAELQAVAGLTGDDSGDQILVATNDASIRDTLTEQYPGTTVESRSGLTGVTPEPTNLPFALAVASGVTGLGLCVIFLTTMMGLELTATRRQIAVLGAVGFRYSSVALLTIVETVTIALLGGSVGVGLGLIGIGGVNIGLVSVFGVPAVAEADPVVVLYGLTTAAVAGLLSTGYPMYTTWRTDLLEELTR